MRSVIVWVILALSCLGQAHARAAFGNLQQGPHSVGLRVVQQYDQQRTFKDRVDPVTGKPYLGERARPLQTLVWYPASRGGVAMRYSDYMQTEASDEVFAQSDAAVAAFMAGRRKRLVDSAGALLAEALMTQPMWAVRDAAPLAGKFPLVIYTAGGGGAAHENADLCEYLASHGYTVIATRSLGTRTRAMNYDMEGLDSQARDIQFLLAYARSLPFADTEHVAAAGWSWAGLANVLAAARDNRIGALVSLDGTREPELAKTIVRTRVAVPWLYFSRRPLTIPELQAAGIETTFSLLNELKYADIYQVIMNGMEHVDFGSAAQRFMGEEHFAQYSRAELGMAYGWTSRYVLEFLNAYLKGDAGGLAYLRATPRAHGAPPYSMLVKATPSVGPAPSRAVFAAELARRGFDQAQALYKDMHQREPAFQLGEGELDSWGYQLWNEQGKLKAGIEVFKLATVVYPDSGNAYDSLAEAYEAAHDSVLAIANYRRSLQLAPRNEHAVARLKVLNAQAEPAK